MMDDKQRDAQPSGGLEDGASGMAPQGLGDTQAAESGELDGGPLMGNGDRGPAGALGNGDR